MGHNTLSLTEERARSMREHTPMRIRLCRVCLEVKPASAFSKGGRKKGICRDCSREELMAWKGAGGGEMDTVAQVYHNLKGNAKRQGIKFALPHEAFREWFERMASDDKCFFCGHTLDLENPHSLQGRTINRLDSAEGYKMGNLVLCCRRCSIIKGTGIPYDIMLERVPAFLEGI